MTDYYLNFEYLTQYYLGYEWEDFLRGLFSLGFFGSKNINEVLDLESISSDEVDRYSQCFLYDIDIELGEEKGLSFLKDRFRKVKEIAKEAESIGGLTIEHSETGISIFQEFGQEKALVYEKEYGPERMNSLYVASRFVAVLNDIISGCGCTAYFRIDDFLEILVMNEEQYNHCRRYIKIAQEKRTT